jgi:NAD(P)H-hydrate epimerase
MVFRTKEGDVVPSVTTDQMREVDRVAVEEFGLSILQMMENAGRTLAEHALEMLGRMKGAIVILAGGGGNGGGGLCCARHLHNRGAPVAVVLDREGTALTGAARKQMMTLQAAGIQPEAPDQVDELLDRTQLVVDALIGYGLAATPRGRTADLIDVCNRRSARVLSLDVPSGLDATTGDAPGAIIHPERTVTLALPKTGLYRVPGELYLADIGIPPEVFRRLGLSFRSPFAHRAWVRLVTASS